jgi:hypothetical protein
LFEEIVEEFAILTAQVDFGRLKLPDPVRAPRAPLWRMPA